MVNPYYPHLDGLPGNQTKALAIIVRNELDLIAAGFDLLPIPSAISGGTANYAVDTGSANAYAVTAGSAIIAYVDGLTLLVKATNANTAASTINVNALGTKAIVRQDGTALQANDILASAIIQISYNATAGNFQITNNALSYANAAAASAVASAGSATASAGSATDSAGSATASQGYYLTFQTVYLGSKAADPTLDNQGNPLITGALYFNTALGQMKTYTGAAWVQAFVPSSVYVLKAGDSLTGGLNELKGADIPSASTLGAIWTAAEGNTQTVTGTTPTISFGTAPQAGSKRTLLAATSWPITAGANVTIPGTASASTYTCAAGDRIEALALTTTSVLLNIFKADGTAITGGTQAFGTPGTAVVNVAASTGAFAACCALSATRSVAFYANASGFPQAILRDAAGANVGTAVQTESNALNGNLQVVPLTSTSAIAIYGVLSTNARAVVLTDSGSTIAAGSVGILDANSADQVTLVPFSATKVGAFWWSNTTSTVRYSILTISGSTITPTAAANVTGLTGAASAFLRGAAFSSTQGVLVFAATGAASASAIAVTESGGVVTLAGQRVVSTGTLVITTGDIAYLSGARFAVAVGGNGFGQAFTLDVSGTGGGAVSQSGKPTPISVGGGAASLRLSKVSAATPLLASSDAGGTNVVLQVFSAVGQSLLQGAGVHAAMTSGARDVCVTGSTALAFYSDSSNSNFPTSRPISLGSIL